MFLSIRELELTVLIQLNLDGTRLAAARTAGGRNYRIHRYIPRTEALFAHRTLDPAGRRCAALATLSKDNILSL